MPLTAHAAALYTSSLSLLRKEASLEHVEPILAFETASPLLLPWSIVQLCPESIVLGSREIETVLKNCNTTNFITISSLNDNCHVYGI